MKSLNKVAIVAGVGFGLGEALCQRLINEGYRVAGLSRSTEVGNELVNRFGKEAFLPLQCDLTDPHSVNIAISTVEEQLGTTSVYIHNAAYLHMGEFLETSAEDFESLWKVTCLGAVHGIQRVLPNMLEQKRGTILVTGATASIKAGSGFSAFSSAKFALRGLTQSLAREYSPQGIHIAHVLLDGLIWGAQSRNKFSAKEEDCLLPEAIADSYFHLIQQHRSSWTQELDLRPDCETF